MSCVCGLPAELDACCGPYLEGTAFPDTAEKLMRSRYTAYATHDVDYVLKTHDPATIKNTSRANVDSWSRSAEWDSLTIVSTDKGQPGDDDGMVEFEARYRVKGEPMVHHERSTFRKLHGRWHFVEGDVVKPPPVVREAPKVGRNDPCPCGSGMKYKKCHGS